MSQPIVSDSAQELYDTSLRPLGYADEQFGWALLHLIEACAGVLQEVRDLSFSQNGYPNWSQSVDIDRCPLIALPWLAQFVGTNPIPEIPITGGDPDEYENKLRAYIRSAPGIRRGTPEAIKAEIRPWLTGNKIVVLNERLGGAYHLQIRTVTSETPSEADVLAAIMRQKPAGIIIDYDSVVGQTYDQLYDNHSPYSDTFGDYTSYQELILDI